MQRVLLSGLVALLSVSASAEPIVYKVIGDWQLRCTVSPPLKLSLDDCWISSSVEEMRNKRHWAAIEVAIDDGETHLALHIPQLVVKDHDIDVVIDEVPFITVPVAQCERGTCFAKVEISDQEIEELKKAKKVQLGYRVTTQQGLWLPFDFTKFSEAFAALRALPSAPK